MISDYKMSANGDVAVTQQQQRQQSPSTTTKRRRRNEIELLTSSLHKFCNVDSRLATERLDNFMDSHKLPNECGGGGSSNSSGRRISRKRKCCLARPTYAYDDDDSDEEDSVSTSARGKKRNTAAVTGHRYLLAAAAVTGLESENIVESSSLVASVIAPMDDISEADLHYFRRLHFQIEDENHDSGFEDL